MRGQAVRTDYLNFRERCVVEGSTEYPYDVIYYGLAASDVPGALPMGEPCERTRGRRPGDPDVFRKHFFNKRIMTDDEKTAGKAVQGGSDSAGL